MSQENLDIFRRNNEAVSSGDIEAALVALDSEIEVHQGPAAIRAFIGEWWDAFDELELTPEEVLDLGHGIVLVVVCQEARPVNSTSPVQRREAYVLEWVEDMLRRTTVYTDIDEARAAAERLAEERG